MSVAQLARGAVHAAMRMRAQLGVAPDMGVCPFDLAEQLGVPVRLVGIPTLEGMYSPETRPTILVGTARPTGRRRFTCGHELGHHAFGHGARVDELDDEAGTVWNPEEFVAQRFAAALLMPKLAVDAAFARRKWSAREATPEQIFTIAQELGVGFTTLTEHLRMIGLLPDAAADCLRRAPLPALRNRLAGFSVEHDLVIVDRHWRRPTIDLEVGDVALVDGSARIEGDCAVGSEGSVPHLRAVAPGTATLTVGGTQSLQVRVSRRRFTGLARFRHLAEVNDE